MDARNLPNSFANYDRPMLAELQDLQKNVQSLRKDIRAEQVQQISKKHLRDTAETLATTWLSRLSPWLADQNAVQNEELADYDSAFKHLLKLSAPSNLRASYLDTLNTVLKSFRDDLILPVQSSPGSEPSASLLGEIFQQLPDAKEDEYLREAVACARHKLYRAATILGWCAAIDRIHRKVEEIGFDKFNVTSTQMASQKKGRFKKFSSPQNVASLSELRMVFDTTILWVLEGMGLIDSNEQTRLKSCFDLRCHCAHPGDAPLTEYNLMSFFSDINKIVLRGPKFQVSPNTEEPKK